MHEHDLFGAEPASAPRQGLAPLLPWQQQAWSLLATDINRIPHALLLFGREGLGQGTFARRFAQLLLCLAPTPEREPCGRCQSCRLFTAGTHPDFVSIAPAEAGRTITVDQIRELNSFLSLKPHTAARKVTVVAPADAMNINAANSLLKQLEEPPLGSILLLVTSAPERLPATIRSRCTRVHFMPPAADEAVSWLAEAGVPEQHRQTLLALAGGAPLQAMVLEEEDTLGMRETLLADLETLSGSGGEVVASASRWKAYGAARTLEWLQVAVGDIIKIRMAGAERCRLANADLGTRLQVCGKRIQLNDLFSFLDQVSAARALLPGPLDEQLMLESLLIRWSGLPR